MKQSEFLIELDLVIDEAQTGLLATVDGSGRPHMRWMTPALLKDRPGALYAVTSKNFAKREQLDKNPKVQWMFQSRSLNKIIYLDGSVNLVDNSSMRSEVLEVVGPRLRVFWNINTDETSLIVLETVMESGLLFLPMKGAREQVKF
ncbi:MAG: pyridoxamine 5'-phosphate oxidase family protein [Sediminispirochaetaceae bacterium]